LTRIEGDPSASALEDISLYELLGNIAADCELEAGARGHRLILESDQPVVVQGQPELLHRATENIVRNAIHHTEEGTDIEIGVQLKGDLATISVRDHGPGVPEPFLQDIFKPFFRVEDDRSRSSGGVGLGLAIARRAVVVHQGRIVAHNAHPGLTVIIELPHARAPERRQEIETHQPSALRFR
jgi:signal transduction histidine kinase